MTARRAALALLPGVTLFPAGCSEGAGPRVSAEPARLELVQAWLRPTLSPDMDWLTYPIGVALDTASGHLFVQDRDWKTVVEIASDGALVRSYGRLGEGPGEIGLPSGIAIDDEHLYVLDNGNLKVLVFRRDDGTVAHEFGVDRLYYDLVALEGLRLMVVPGGMHAVEILDLEGRIVGGIGDPAVLPGTCAGCTLAVLPDGRVVVLDGTGPTMWVLSERETRLIDLHGYRLLIRWRHELEADVRRMRATGGGRRWMGDQLELGGPSQVVAIAGPPTIMTTGQELWRIDVDTGNIERYDYGEPFVGYFLAVDWPRIVTTHVREGAILEYRAPAPAGR